MISAVVFVLFTGAFVAITLSGARPHGPDENWPADGPCTVRLSGHKMNASATGPGARDVCERWLYSGEYASKPAGHLQCSFTRDSLIITVYDSAGGFYGGDYCLRLRSWSDTGGTVPDIAVPVIPSSS